MRTTADKSIGTTGCFAVGYVQSGRQNAKRFFAVCGGHVVYVNAQDGTRATAERLALRADRLVAMWRGCAK